MQDLVRRNHSSADVGISLWLFEHAWLHMSTLPGIMELETAKIVTRGHTRYSASRTNGHPRGISTSMKIPGSVDHLLDTNALHKKAAPCL